MIEGEMKKENVQSLVENWPWHWSLLRTPDGRLESARMFRPPWETKILFQAIGKLGNNKLLSTTIQGNWKEVENLQFDFAQHSLLRTPRQNLLSGGADLHKSDILSNLLHCVIFYQIYSCVWYFFGFTRVCYILSNFHQCVIFLSDLTDFWCNVIQ